MLVFMTAVNFFSMYPVFHQSSFLKCIYFLKVVLSVTVCNTQQMEKM